MRIFIIGLILVTMAIGSCSRPIDNGLQPSSKISEVSGNDLKVEMYMFPSPGFIQVSDQISLKFVLTNLGNLDMDGRISVEDSPHTSQFSGIEEPAVLDFNIRSEDGKSNDKELIVPGTSEFAYSGNLESTSFTATVVYEVQKTVESEKFCLKYSPRNNINKCDYKGSVRSRLSNTIGNFDYEYADSDGDDIVDRMTIKFQISEKCDILDQDNLLVESLHVSLKNSGTTFDCFLDDKVNSKIFRCNNADSLQPIYPFYDESVVAKFKYGCSIVLKSGFIDFNKET